LIFSETAYSRWLKKKCMDLLYKLKTLHSIPPLLVTVITLPLVLAVKDSKLTENGVRRGCEDRQFYKIKTVEFKNFHAVWV
jgi:hypothetical protein